MISPLSDLSRLKILSYRSEDVRACRQNFVVERSLMERDEAVKFFRELGEEYKAEIISSILRTKNYRCIAKVTLSIFAAGPMFLTRLI